MGEQRKLEQERLEQEIFEQERLEQERIEKDRRAAEAEKQRKAEEEAERRKVAIEREQARLKAARQAEAEKHARSLAEEEEKKAKERKNEQESLTRRASDSVISGESDYDNDDFDDESTIADTEPPPLRELARRSSFLNKADIAVDEDDKKFKQKMENVRNTMIMARAPSLIPHSIFDDQSIEDSIDHDDVLDESSSPGHNDPLARFLRDGSSAGDSIGLDDQYSLDEESMKSL